MATKTYYTAEVQDPVTGTTETLTADTEDQLEQLVDEHLEVGYPVSRLQSSSPRDQ
ncbi:hypothetical protein [Nocardioides sp.]|uniref:hypothetical protein n=1 Tax=Nocardioides sp. TaxID=35761 RepID=UPI002736374C|nr:hypothetical protein [Nocardioides sp.]MDP3890273.1 hypothetical protein [Nocardioides sp.]